VADQVISAVWGCSHCLFCGKISVFKYFSTWNTVLVTTAVLWLVQGFEM